MNEPTAAEVEAAARNVYEHLNPGLPFDWQAPGAVRDREWAGHVAHAVLAAAYAIHDPLVEARLREQIVGDIDAEYLKVAADEGATLESDRVITAICNGLLRARRVVRGD